MRNLKGTVAAALFVLFSGTSTVYAVDILDTKPEYKERKVAWNTPVLSVSGEGKLNVYGTEYKGLISCLVSISAVEDRHNKVKVEDEDNTIEIEAKSNVGSVSLSKCTVATDSKGGKALASVVLQEIEFLNGEVKVKIKGYDIGFDGERVFEKMKIKARHDKRHDKRHAKRHAKKRGTDLKLKLYDGTITPLVKPKKEVIEEVVRPSTPR